MAITQEDIQLMSDDKNKEIFVQCKPALDALKNEKDETKQKELAKTILQNFVKEKTIYILNTNELTKNVMAQLTDKIGEINDLDSFLKVAQEKPEALAELKKIGGSQDSAPQSGSQTGSAPDAQAGAAPDAQAGSQTGSTTGTQTGTGSDAQTGTGSGAKTDGTKTDGAKTDGEGEEDPWIRSALSKLRSKKLY